MHKTGGQTILLAMDRPELRRVSAVKFCEWGYAVLAVANASQALEQAQHHTLDVVICDKTLADMTGVDLCTRLCRMGSQHKPGCILLTPPDQILDLTVPPVIAYQLAQPFSSRELRNVVEQLTIAV